MESEQAFGPDKDEDAARRDDPAESGALEDEGEGSRLATGMRDDPVESGALEEEELVGDMDDEEDGGV